MSPEPLLHHFGYLAVFIGTFLEGETILVFAGFFAERGYLKWLLVVLCAFGGAFAGSGPLCARARGPGVRGGGPRRPRLGGVARTGGRGDAAGGRRAKEEPCRKGAPQGRALGRAALSPPAGASKRAPFRPPLT